MQQPENASGRTVGSGRSDDAEQTSRDRTLVSVQPTAAELICSPTLAPRKK